MLCGDADEPGPSKMRKVSSTTQRIDISATDNNSSDTEKYNILKFRQSFDKKFQFPQQQFGTKPSGKPHMH